MPTIFPKDREHFPKKRSGPPKKEKGFSEGHGFQRSPVWLAICACADRFEALKEMPKHIRDKRERESRKRQKERSQLTICFSRWWGGAFGGALVLIGFYTITFAIAIVTTTSTTSASTTATSKTTTATHNISQQ